MSNSITGFVIIACFIGLIWAFDAALKKLFDSEIEELKDAIRESVRLENELRDKENENRN